MVAVAHMEKKTPSG